MRSVVLRLLKKFTMLLKAENIWLKVTVRTARSVHHAIGFCSRTVLLFLASLVQMHMALIWDIHQWFCKESSHGSYDKTFYYTLLSAP